MDKKEERARMKRTRLGIGSIALVLLLLGAFGMLWTATTSTVYADLVNEDHMTDSGIAYRDLDNATYTYDREYIENKVDDLANLMLLSIIPLFVGMAIFYVMIVMPDERDEHRLFCRQWQNEKFAGNDGLEDMKYCPECGLKLSRLEKK